MVLNDQVYGYLCDFLAELLFFQNIQVNRLDFNALKCWQTCHYIELSEYKLYMGHIHTLVLTREWIAMLLHHLPVQQNYPIPSVYIISKNERGMSVPWEDGCSRGWEFQGDGCSRGMDVPGG